MKQLLIILALTFQTIFLYSQQNINNWRIFEENPQLMVTQLDDYESYISTTYPNSIPESEFGEYKAYLRFMNYWVTRLGYKNGQLSYEPYYQAAMAYVDNPICINDNYANWQPLQKYNSSAQEDGLISEVLYDPLNPDAPLISSNHGGLWKYNDNLCYWYNVTDEDQLRIPGLSATEIVRNPFNHDILYASTASGLHGVEYGAGIIKSTDNGSHWSILTSFLSSTYSPRVIKILIDPNDTNPNNGINIFAITKDKVYVSYNSGDSWSEWLSQPTLNDFTELFDIKINPSGEILLSTFSLYGHDGQCFIYTNNSWTEILSTSPDISPQRTRFTTPVNGIVFAMIDNTNGDGDSRDLYKSTDNGHTWQLYLNGIYAPGEKYDIEYSAASDYIYYAGQQYLFVIDQSTKIVERIDTNTHYYNRKKKIYKF